MGLKLTRKAPAWEGAVLAGNTLTLRLPVGLTFHQVYLTYAFLATATSVALEDAVGEVRFLINGKPTWAIQASELDKKNQFEGRTAGLGILTFDFDRYNLRTRPAEEFTSIGTGMADDPTPATTLTIEMDLKSGSGITSGTLDTRMRQSESRKLGLFKKIRRYNHTFGGAGDVEIADYPKGDLINAAYFFESANDIDRVVLERDDFIMFDRLKELNSRIQTDGVRVPIENLFVYDTCEDGNGTDQLVTRGVNDLRWRFTLDGAMTITTIMEYIGALET